MSFQLSDDPKILKQRFFSLTTPQDVAQLLDIKYSDLTYYLYRMPLEEKYSIFTLAKKSGGTREIMSPNTSIKILQQKLLQVLEAVYKPKRCVHGFVRIRTKLDRRSIKTNAYKHRNQKYVLNIDLKDFFPSINFGRVRGMFMSNPYKLPPNVATVIAQLCCNNNQLPQGAPTSPIISNMICAKLDSQLQSLARESRCYYTRYGDDITFSTSLRDFPKNIAYQMGITTNLGLTLRQIIKNNGFAVNNKKVRLQKWYHRQAVTGIIVNEFTNVPRNFVRQIRAMLYDWKVNGYENAQDRHWELRDKKAKHRNPEFDRPPFYKILSGKIAYLRMVREAEGKVDEIHQRFLGKYLYLMRRDKDYLDIEYIVPQSGRIFISYSRQDADFTIRIAENLSLINEYVWIDVNDIPAGMNWSNAIEEGLEECDLMVLIISPDSMISEHVEIEWKYFIENGKNILPIQYKHVDNLPNELEQIQYIDFQDDNRFAHKFRNLKRRIYRIRQTNQSGNASSET